MPFAGYTDHADCVSKNQDKDNPHAYCNSLESQTEQWPRAKTSEAQSRQPIQIREADGGLVKFKARILAAIPGLSRNKRQYTREILEQSASMYEGKPFILDHNIEDSERVIGLIARGRYGTERGADGRAREGLWLDAVGMMDPNMFKKMTGDGSVPPLIRGVSIGGEGEGDWQRDGSILIRNFTPEELSVTPFPGIPAAHVAAINQIREQYRSHEHVKNMDLSLREAERIARNTPSGLPPALASQLNDVVQDMWKASVQEAAVQYAREINEGPVPMQDAQILGTSTRQRGFDRPGLPPVGARSMPVTHQTPKSTTSAVTGLSLDPEQHSTGQAGYTATGADAALHGKTSSTEQAPGTVPDASWVSNQSPDAKALRSLGTTSGASTTNLQDANMALPSSGSQSHPKPGTPGPGPARGNKKPTPQLQGMVHYPGGGRTVPGSAYEDPSKGPSERVGEDHEPVGVEPGDEAPPDKGKDDDEEEEESIQTIGPDEPRKPGTPGKPMDDDDETVQLVKRLEQLHPELDGRMLLAELAKEHGPSPHIPGEPMGKHGPHAAANAYDSPADSGTEKGESGKYGVDALKTFHPANPMKEERFIPDAIPAQARANALMFSPTVIDSWKIQHQQKMEKEAQSMIAAWAKLKEQPYQPLPKITVRTEDSKGPEMVAEARAKMVPSQAHGYPSIPSRAVTATAPTLPTHLASSGIANVQSRAREIMERIKKEPYANQNVAKRIFHEMIMSGDVGVRRE